MKVIMKDISKEVSPVPWLDPDDPKAEVADPKPAGGAWGVGLFNSASCRRSTQYNPSGLI